MPAYDELRFSPPAPVAQVVLRNRDTGGTWPEVPMLIDTGADVTAVPQEALTRLGLAATAGKRYEVVGFDGRASAVGVVDLELVFCHKTFRGQFLLSDQPHGVLGRNVLNALPLLFDGPALTWAEQTSPPPR
jgi:predicted aspartyl protease